MRTINQKEYAARVEDYVSEKIYDMLVNLMTHFKRDGILRDLDQMSEDSIAEDTWVEAENLKYRAISALERLGLDVQGDGRDY